MLTQDEMLGFHIVRALAHRHIDASRIVARPAQSYCAILLDDNNRKSIGRLHFNSQNVKYLGTFVDKKETRRQIQGPNGIYDLESFIVDRLRELDPKAFGLAETAASISRDQQEQAGSDDEIETDSTIPVEEDASEAVTTSSSQDSTGTQDDERTPSLAFEHGLDQERREPEADDAGHGPSDLLDVRRDD